MWIEKHGKVYRVRDVVAGQKITLSPRGGLPSKTAAKTYMINLLADQSRGEYIDPRAGRALLGDWVEAWWPAYSAKLKPSGRISARGILDRYILPAFAETPLDDVSPLDIQVWTANLLAGKHAGARKPLAVKTVRNAHGLAHKVFSAAVREKMLRANPCARTGLPERVHTEMRFLTEPEAGRLLAAIGDHYRPLVLLLLATGLRWAEAAGLKVANLDVLERQLRVVETMQELASTSELVFVPPKSRRSRRTVSFPKSVAAELVPLVANKDRTDLVFRAQQGGPVRYRVFRKLWVKAIAAAGLQGLRIHDTRHTHAAWLISAGVPLTAISRRLGHESIMVTSDMYGHLLPSVDEGIIATLDKALPDQLGGILGELGADSPGLTRTQLDSAAGQST